MLLAELDPKWEPPMRACVVRVKRNFPEIFSNWIRSVPPNFELDLDEELKSLLNATTAGAVHLELDEVAVDWFDLEVVVKVEDVELSREEIKLLLDARGKWVRL